MRKTIAALIGAAVLAVVPVTADAAARRPTLTIQPRSPSGSEDLLIGITAKNLPRPPRGEHYRAKLWGHVGSRLDCASSGGKDWLEPNGKALLMPDGDLVDGWCPGPASVTVSLVPNSSPKSYNGRTIVTTRFRIRR